MSLRNKVGYPFKPAHAVMPLAWRDLDLYPRLIMGELWRQSDGGVLNIRRAHIVRDLDAPKKGDRVNAQRAIDKLFAEGFLIDLGSEVRISTEIRSDCDRNTEVGTSAFPTQAKPSETLDVDPTDQIKLEREERETRVRATPPEGDQPERAETKPEEPVSFRPPLPEPPPDLPKPGPTPEAQLRQLTERICDYMRDKGKQVAGFTPKPDRNSARRLAEWCLLASSQEDWRSDAITLAKRVCDGLLGSERAAQRAYPLVWAAANPPEFLGAAPSAPKPQASAPRQQWEPPAWQREAERIQQAEINGAIRECLDEPDPAVMSRLISSNLRKRMAQAPELEAVGT